MKVWHRNHGIYNEGNRVILSGITPSGSKITLTSDYGVNTGNINVSLEAGSLHSNKLLVGALTLVMLRSDKRLSVTRVLVETTDWNYQRN